MGRARPPTRLPGGSSWRSPRQPASAATVTALSTSPQEVGTQYPRFPAPGRKPHVIADMTGTSSPRFAHPDISSTQPAESLALPARRADDHVMRLRWLAREYERTCADCGYSWRVPRQLAGRRVIPIPGATSGMRARGVRQAFIEGPAPVDREAGLQLAEEAAAFRVCQECGSVRYTQHPVRR
jgi:hypothetical protein